MSELQPDVQMSVWTGAQHTSCCLRFLPALFFLALSRVLSSLLSSSAAFGAPCCWVLYTSSGARIAASDATYTDSIHNTKTTACYELHSTARQSMAQHGTARHSSAWPSTAQSHAQAYINTKTMVYYELRNAAQHSTALHVMYAWAATQHIASRLT